MIRILLKKDEPSLLNQLATEYKAFKGQNPKKTARIPTTLKQLAKDVHVGGTAPEEMEKALGLSRQGMLRWLEPAAADGRKPVRQRKARTAPLPAVGHATREASPASNSVEPSLKPLSMRSPAEAPPADDSKWVRIRIDGREIEVARTDFWDLLQSRV